MARLPSIAHRIELVSHLQYRSPSRGIILVSTVIFSKALYTLETRYMLHVNICQQFFVLRRIMCALCWSLA